MRRELSEKEILDTVRDIRHEAPGIGAYKLYLMLKELYPDGMRGRDWFYGLMHESHLMLKPGKRRHTTSSNHPYRKYKNMIKGLTVNRINQLWVADITYIDTDEGVAYLHLLTDAFTHEIIGWVLSDSLVASNTVTALEMGISHVSPLGFDGLIHHSDRGVQYCCNQYIDRLQAIKATISMTEDYKPTDNAIAERVNGIILRSEWDVAPYLRSGQLVRVLAPWAGVASDWMTGRPPWTGMRRGLGRRDRCRDRRWTRASARPCWRRWRGGPYTVRRNQI